jgi:alkylation response protein AidB-like acyl-CoA dehydrogenase
MRTSIDQELRARLSDDGRLDVRGALDVATQLSAQQCRPGDGRTYEYLRTLATLGLVDASLARIVEPHLDAHAILQQAGVGPGIPAIGADSESTWGVYAAHASGLTLEATEGLGGWTLSGAKPWCSLAGQLSHAVITAAVAGRGQQAFAVRLDPRHVRVTPTQWVSRGLAAIPSGPIEVRELPAVPLGDPGWYVRRPGFAWGGIGVAAVWYGIALGLRERMLRHLIDRAPDPIALAQFGSVEESLFTAEACLEHAAAAIDAGIDDPLLLGQRVRAAVAGVSEKVLHTAGHVLGPGPLVGEEDYARRVADLGVYLRQHHGQRDLAYLGELALAAAEHRHG